MGSDPAQLDPGFWRRLRSAVQRIDTNLADLVARERKDRGSHRRLPVLDLAALIVAVAAAVLAVVGVAQGSTAINQNSIALDGLNDSLQRADIAAVYEVGMSWCGDPDRDVVTSTIATAILTNVGRLPITIMHVGDGSRQVNDFASAPVGDDPSATKKGPFLLDVGRAVYVAYGSNRVNSVSSEVVLRLSDGTTAKTSSAGGEARWLTSVMPSIEPGDVTCPSGVLMSVPLADLGSSRPDFVVATPSPQPSP